MNPRLKKIIFDKLTEDLSKVEIILSENQSIWFIDRANKYWYFELEKSGKLWWRYEFFTDFFILFCLKAHEFQPLLSEWVEGVLNCGVNTTDYEMGQATGMVEGVLNRGVSATGAEKNELKHSVRGVLNRGVSATGDLGMERIATVEKIFDSNVNMTTRSGHRLHSTVEGILNHGYRKGSRKVDEVLNIGVNTTSLSYATFELTVEDVLNQEIVTSVEMGNAWSGITEGVLKHGYRKGSRKVEEVLNREIKEIEGGELFENDKVEDILNRDTNSTSIVVALSPLLMEGNLNHKVVSISHASEKIAFTQQVLLNELISKIESATPLDTPAHGSVDEVLKNS